MTKDKGSRSRSKTSLENSSEEDLKEWEDARCPVCMDHPHNAVLLKCSSHDNGCRPYMCDTSYRHSNCLDQFLKSKTACPLCRGPVDGYAAVEPARRFMNAKPRCCARETCGFDGTYGDLRRHARLEHPLVRPMEADPERERAWRRMERQRGIQDLLSTFEEEDMGGGFMHVRDGLLTVFFLFRVFRAESGSGAGAVWRRRPRRLLWGERFDMEDAESGTDGLDDGRRVRRRSTPESEL